MGIHVNRGCELASADLAVACSRLSNLWAEPGRPSFRQCFDPRRQCCVAVSAVAVGYKASGTESVGGRSVCPASDQRRVGGMGGGTEECSEHAVLFLGDRRLCVVCPKTGLAAISAGRSPVRCGLDGQADGHHAPFCTATSGLLAAGANAAQRNPERSGHLQRPTAGGVLKVAAGESATAVSFGCQRMDHSHRATIRSAYSRGVLLRQPN